MKIVLCIDVDNDLYEKARVKGPLIGLKRNKEAAVKLALVDPEDPDANAIFAAIKLYNELKQEGEEVEIVTIVGDKTMGYKASRRIAAQMDKIMYELKPESVILVSDGVADETVLPIIKSRVKIEATKNVVMKQAKELEKTYFVLLEKLKDPYYSRIILGTPALLLFIISIVTFFNMPWQYISFTLGIYLLYKGFGIDEYVRELSQDLKISIERPGWLAYAFGTILIILSLWTGIDSIRSTDNLIMIAEFLRGAFVLLPWGILVLLIGRTIDALALGKKFVITNYALYAIAVISASIIIQVSSNWIVNDNPPYNSFKDVVIATSVALIVMHISTYLLKTFKNEIIINSNLIDKEVINDIGSYVGKITGINQKKSTIIVKSDNKIFEMPIDNIKDIGKVVVIK